jgi:hypothetical protein
MKPLLATGPIDHCGLFLAGSADRSPPVYVSVFGRRTASAKAGYTVTTVGLSDLDFVLPGFRSTRFVRRFVATMIRGLEPIAFCSGFENTITPMGLEDLERGLPLRGIPYIGYFPPTVVKRHSARAWALFDAVVRDPEDHGALAFYRGKPWTARLASGGILYRLAGYETGERDMRLRKLMRREFGVTVSRRS